MPTRAEQRTSTLLRLGDAAVELFDVVGPDVTIDQIAERAGMSRRTVHRWCGAKEELAFVHPLLWIDVFHSALGAAPVDAAPSERLVLGARAIARHVDQAPEAPARAFTVAALNPALLGGFHAVFYRWVEVIAAEVERSGADPLEARITGSAVMGMVDAVTRAWLAEHPGESFSAVLERGIVRIEPLLSRLDDGLSIG